MKRECENAAAAFSYNAFVPAGTFINEHTCIINVTTIMDLNELSYINVGLRMIITLLFPYPTLMLHILSI